LLGLREKEIAQLRQEIDLLRTSDVSLKHKLEKLEQEKVELNGQLLKKQRGISPFKVQSRSQYQMIEDLQEAMMAKGPIEEEDLRNNYN